VMSPFQDLLKDAVYVFPLMQLPFIREKSKPCLVEFKATFAQLIQQHNSVFAFVFFVVHAISRILQIIFCLSCL